MNCTCDPPTNDCPEHGTGCDGRRYMALKVERDRLREELRIAREALEYMLDHHLHGDECLCDAARSVAAAGVSLTEQKV